MSFGLRMILRLTLISVLSLLASASWAAQTTEMVAEVAGHKLTRTDLDQQEGGKLLNARYQYYLAERDAVDQLIDNYLLENQAKKEGLGVAQLLDKHVNQQVKDPDEAALKIYFEGLDTDQPFEALRDKIRDHVHNVLLKRQRAAYLKQLRAAAIIQVALQPPSTDISPDGAPVRGRGDAPVTMVEFADYECPYCQKIDPEVRKLAEEFSGKLKLAFRDFPLPMHKHAEKAAEAARCAEAQGKFWEFHDGLFADNGKTLELAQLKQRARNLKLDGAKFDKCLDGGEQSAAVQKDLSQGQHLGLTGTPSFFINGHFVSGAVDYSTLREVVNQQLTAAARGEISNGGGM